MFITNVQTISQLLYQIIFIFIRRERKKMALFSTAKDSLTIVGILGVTEEKLPIKLQKYKTAINYIHIVCVISWIILYLCAALYFLLFEAKTFNQYFGSGLYIILNILRIIVYKILRSNITTMSNLWNESEDTINKRRLEIYPNFFFIFFS